MAPWSSALRVSVPELRRGIRCGYWAPNPRCDAGGGLVVHRGLYRARSWASRFSRYRFRLYAAGEGYGWLLSRGPGARHWCRSPGLSASNLRERRMRAGRADWGRADLGSRIPYCRSGSAHHPYARGSCVDWDALPLPVRGPGDEVSLSISQLGILTVTVTPGPAPRAKVAMRRRFGGARRVP